MLALRNTQWVFSHGRTFRTPTLHFSLTRCGTNFLRTLYNIKHKYKRFSMFFVNNWILVISGKLLCSKGNKTLQDQLLFQLDQSKIMSPMCVSVFSLSILKICVHSQQSLFDKVPHKLCVYRSFRLEKITQGKNSCVLRFNVSKCHHSCLFPNLIRGADNF